MLKRDGVDAECCLLGFLEVNNPAAVPRGVVEQWVREGVVRYLGVHDDVRCELAHADCVVLPSYREGTPRSLLEAAAMARPIIAADSVGCRDVVEPGVNGLVCHVRDSADLAQNMLAITRLSPVERELLGRRGRGKVELQFSEFVVID
jgi:glycosyltransferase involved in cell wall biosynthesis